MGRTAERCLFLMAGVLIGLALLRPAVGTEIGYSALSKHADRFELAARNDARFIRIMVSITDNPATVEPAYREARRVGMRPILMLWGTENPERSVWREFVRDVARRFPRALVEAWNEPNGSFFGAILPARYFKLLRIVSQEAGRHRTLAAAPDPAAPRALDYFSRAGRFARFLNVHLYPNFRWQTVPMALAHLRAVREIVGRRAPIMVTEFGFTTDYGVDHRQQAALGARTLCALERRPNIVAALWYWLGDGGDVPWRGMAAVDPQGSPWPVMGALGRGCRSRGNGG
jgi:hypothetical protein